MWVSSGRVPLLYEQCFFAETAPSSEEALLRQQWHAANVAGQGAAMYVDDPPLPGADAKIRRCGFIGNSAVRDDILESDATRERVARFA
jgi:hypothetical protein